MRSLGLCEAMARRGLELYRLRGGYRAYRRYILRDMERMLKGKKLIVLTGRTGVGKTAVLRMLKEEGLPVLDLEAMAGDRGSVFGSVGVGKGTSQKMFDALLYEELRKCDGDLVFIEDESRRIGRVYIPDPLWQVKARGIYVEITASLEKRVENILREYTAFEGWEQEAAQALDRIAKYLGPQRYALLRELLLKGEVRELVRLLIEDYYDRRYRYFGSPLLSVSAEDPQECVQRLKELYNLIQNEGKVPNSISQRGQTS